MDRIIMDELIITKEGIDEFRNYLRLEEKSENTIEKYMRDIKAFWQYAGTQVVTKELAIAYKENLLSDEWCHLAPIPRRGISVILFSISYPTTGCVFIRSYSLSVNCDFFLRTLSGMPIFPISCKSAII